MVRQAENIASNMAFHCASHFAPNLCLINAKKRVRQGASLTIYEKQSPRGKSAKQNPLPRKNNPNAFHIKSALDSIFDLQSNNSKMLFRYFDNRMCPKIIATVM